MFYLFEISVFMSPLAFLNLLGDQQLTGSNLSSDMLEMYQPVELFQWLGFGEPRADHSAVFR